MCTFLRLLSPDRFYHSHFHQQRACTCFLILINSIYSFFVFSFFLGGFKELSALRDLAITSCSAVPGWDLGISFFFLAEWHPEDGPTWLHQTFPPWGQWEAQHDCPVLQHVQGDWGEPWGSCLHPTETDWVSALGWAKVTAVPPGQWCWPGKVLRAKKRARVHEID